MLFLSANSSSALHPSPLTHSLHPTMASTHRPSSSRESTINSTHSSTSSHSIPASCEKSTVTKATVIIVGSGIGGLTLAALLERAGIEYQIFERAAKVKPLGSALSIGPNIMYLFGSVSFLSAMVTNTFSPMGQLNNHLESLTTCRPARHPRRDLGQCQTLWILDWIQPATPGDPYSRLQPC